MRTQVSFSANINCNQVCTSSNSAIGFAHGRNTHYDNEEFKLDV
jgi:hypothetical protein